MKYLTQKQTTKLWSGLALAALLLTVLLWCLTSTVTFTPKQAIERAAKIEQIAPLTLLDEKEVPGFRLLLTGNQDNLVLLGWSDRYHHNLRNASNHLLSLDLTAGDPALQALPCAVWSAAGTDRTLLALIGTTRTLSRSLSCSTSTWFPLRLTSSIMFSAMTIGFSSSISCNER